ncbi:uncharacterized protein HD556DRAFT_1309156 [Suillus plorans]|uniref:Uncharacterized protein n=1 Tax=Suillus plorans TaxID=116603 RepID=A0A9P7AMT5_9AGAM|nr:uncharacterized protein HD556DRAFT_1309156 [Suillus plorans]KAG1792608.1 hypothetical protein HD556DRAFT_1309156 [Suillus plorans]
MPGIDVENISNLGENQLITDDSVVRNSLSKGRELTQRLRATIIENSKANRAERIMREGTKPNNFAEYASKMPSPTAARNPTAAEKQAMIKWIKEDVQMKGIICRKLSAVIQGLLDESSTAQEQWDILAMNFGHLDMSSQFEL